MVSAGRSFIRRPGGHLSSLVPFATFLEYTAES